MSQADITRYSTVNLRLIPSHHDTPIPAPSINSNTHTMVAPVFFQLQSGVVGEHISNTLSSEGKCTCIPLIK